MIAPDHQLIDQNLKNMLNNTNNINKSTFQILSDLITPPQESTLKRKSSSELKMSIDDDFSLNLGDKFVKQALKNNNTYQVANTNYSNSAIEATYTSINNKTSNIGDMIFYDQPSKNQNNNEYNLIENNFNSNNSKSRSSSSSLDDCDNVTSSDQNLRNKLKSK